MFDGGAAAGPVVGACIYSAKRIRPAAELGRGIFLLALPEQVSDIVDMIVASSNTGRAGDGKVWTVDVQEAVRVRTGERGAAAV